VGDGWLIETPTQSVRFFQSYLNWDPFERPTPSVAASAGRRALWEESWSLQSNIARWPCSTLVRKTVKLLARLFDRFADIGVSRKVNGRSNCHRGRIQWSRSLERITTPPDGTAVRDYVHVCDLAAAHVKALDHLLADAPSASINLGTGRGHSIREVISAVEGISGRTVPVFEGPRRAGDPPALIADPQLGRSVLGWTPRRSDLSTIVLTAWQWHQKNAPQAISAAASRAGMRVASAKAAPPNVL
jgi:NAD dependent epimerase/dehydratase family